MDFFKVLVAFCFMFVLCCASSDDVHGHKLPNQNDAEYSVASSSSLPRKLKLNEESTDQALLVKGFADKNVAPDNFLRNMDREASSGNNLTPRERQENAMHAKEKGEGREGYSSSKESEYVTMDYPWVRKRRPIHNKQVPFVP